MAAPISEPDSISVGGLDAQSGNQVLQTHADISELSGRVRPTYLSKRIRISARNLLVVP